MPLIVPNLVALGTDSASDSSHSLCKVAYCVAFLDFSIDLFLKVKVKTEDFFWFALRPNELNP